MSVPALRFKEFSSEWEEKKLGEICEFSQGVQVDLEFQISNKQEGYIKFLRIENYTQNSLDFRFIPINLSNNKFIGLDDIVVVRYGATAGFISRGHSGVLANNLFKIIPNENKLDKNYLFLLLRSDKVFKFFQSAMAGGAMPALSFKIVGVLPLSFPSLPEQTKIANFLTAVDEKISLLTQKADLLSQYKKGVMQQIFSQELRFKDDDGQEFPEWEDKALGEIASFFRGGSLSKSDIDVNGKFDCIHYGELFTTYSEIITTIKSKTNITNTINSEVGDILMPSSDVTPAGLAKACCILKSGVVLGGDINVVRVENTIEPTFISYLLNFEKNKIIQLVSGTTVKHIYIKDIKSIELSIPTSIEEQTKIANFLSAIDEKITTNQTQLNAVKQYKQGLLQQMFV